MTRPIPQLATGYSVDKSSRIHANRRGAYYQIAKAMVLAKYPPGIDVDPDRAPADWSESLTERRAERERQLFWVNDEHFDADRFARFVRRVARFIAFVDKRRTGRDRWSALTDAQLTAKFEDAEGEAGRWMMEANAMRLELRRREEQEP